MTHTMKPSPPKGLPRSAASSLRLSIKTLVNDPLIPANTQAPSPVRLPFQPRVYKAYECCEKVEAPLLGFRILRPGAGGLTVYYSDLVSSAREDTDTVLYLTTPRLEYILRGSGLGNPAFFKALHRGQVEFITQWDQSRVPVTDGRMCIIEVEIIEKHAKDPATETSLDAADTPGKTSSEVSKASPPDHAPSRSKMPPAEEAGDGPVPTG